MDAVKFVPPGGHRACLSCSAAKAKCVFADDANAGDSFVDALDFINSTTSDLAGPAHSPSSTKTASGQEVASQNAPGPASSKIPSRNAGNLGEHGLATNPKQPAGPGGFSTDQEPSLSARRTPSSSNLPTPSGGASTAAYRGPGSSQSVQKRATLGMQHQSTLQLGPAPAVPVGTSSLGHMQEQYTIGVTATTPASVEVAPMSHLPPMPGHAPIPVHIPPGQHPLPTPTQSTVSPLPLPPPPPPLPSFCLPPPPHINSPPPADPSSLNSYAGSSSSATVIPPGGLGSSTGPTSSATSPMPTGPGAAQDPAVGASAMASASAPAPASTPNAHQALIDSVFNMEEREADEILRFYRDAFSKFNPYMEPTTKDTKVADLQAQKPLVWLSIVFVTCYHDFERQNRLGRAIIWYITDQVFLSSGKSLHLLQGLLIFVNWFISQNFVLPQFTNLIHVTMALITDLGLNKLEFSKTFSRSPLDRYVTKTMHGPSMVAPDEGHTLEERRALAGGFILSHAMSDGIIMVTPLHYTLQLEDTCRLFEATYTEKAAVSAPITTVVAADYQLAITVRLYYLISRVLQVQREADLRGGTFLIPVRTHIEGFSAELLQIWDGLSRELRSDFQIQLVYYTAKIYIFELGLSSRTTPFKSHSTPSRDSDDGSSSSGGGGLHDGDMPIQCYLAAKSFFDVYLTLPVSLYHQFPVTIITQLVHADITLAKLTAYFRGNTNPPGVPEGITLPTFSDVVDAVASRFQRVRTVPHPLGYTIRNMIFDAFAVRLRSYKVLDLAGRKKNREKDRAAAAAKKAKMAAVRAASANGPTAIVNRTPPTGNAVLSISSLIGSVPEGMNMDQDNIGSEAEGAGAGAGPYPTVEMDLEADDHAGMHGDLPDRSRPFTVDEEPMPDADMVMDMTELTGSDEEDQADWWAWYHEIQNSLFGAPKMPSTAAGSVSGASAAVPSVSNASISNASASISASGRSGTADSFMQPGTYMRRKGPSSVGSIDSLLNNNDQEPNFNSYMRGRNR